MRISLPSVQSLLLQMCIGKLCISTGTGFVAMSKRGPLLITNWHNVSGRNTQTKQVLSPTGAIPDCINIVHNQAGQLGSWVSRTETLTADGTARWIEHPRFGDRADIAALPLTELVDVELYLHDLLGGPELLVRTADTVSVVGFPFGMHGGGSLALWATGFVASEPDVDYDNLPVFLIDCRGRPGQSGSAVIAHRNGGMVAMADGGSVVFNGPVTKFLGVYSGRINDQSDLGMVWKATAVAELVDSV